LQKFRSVFIDTKYKNAILIAVIPQSKADFHEKDLKKRKQQKQLSVRHEERKLIIRLFLVAFDAICPR